MGKNARIYKARFFKPTTGSRNLTVEDNVHIDTGCLIDLSDEVFIRANAALSPRVAVLTHADQASIISEQRKLFPRRTARVVTGPLVVNWCEFCNPVRNGHRRPHSSGRQIELEKSAGEPGSPGASAGILEDIDD